jgi:hypothetical protein
VVQIPRMDRCEVAVRPTRSTRCPSSSKAHQAGIVREDLLFKIIVDHWDGHLERALGDVPQSPQGTAVPGWYGENRLGLAWRGRDSHGDCVP